MHRLLWSVVLFGTLDFDLKASLSTASTIIGTHDRLRLAQVRATGTVRNEVPQAYPNPTADGSVADRDRQGGLLNVWCERNDIPPHC